MLVLTYSFFQLGWRVDGTKHVGDTVYVSDCK